MRVSGERRLGHCGHALHQGLDPVAWLAGSGQNCAVAVGFQIEAQHGELAAGFRLQLDTVVEIEVAHTGRERHVHLPPVDVIAGAVDDSPHRFVAERPAAGVDAVGVRGIERLPIGADQKWRHPALDGRHAARSLGVAGVDADPDAPHVLPALPADAVEEGELQVAGLVERPAVADVNHVAGFEPLVPVDHGDKRKAVLAPGHHVPTEGLVAGADLGLKGEGVADLFRGQ